MEIEEKKINSFDDYIKLISNYPSEDYFYRGHVDANWKLSPSIARVFDNVTSQSIRQDMSLKNLEYSINLRFKRLAVPYLKTIPTKSIDWLVIGQHYGLPTRLLDWTENPLVALFYAIIEEKDCLSAIWMLQPNHWYSMDFPIDDIEDINDIYMFYPQSSDPRVLSQKGCFTIHPLPVDETPLPSLDQIFSSGTYSINELIKVIIPNDKLLKKSMLLRLYDLGINYNFILPDLEGLTKQIKFEFTMGKIKR